MYPTQAYSDALKRVLLIPNYLANACTAAKKREEELLKEYYEDTKKSPDLARGYRVWTKQVELNKVRARAAVGQVLLAHPTKSCGAYEFTLLSYVQNWSDKESEKEEFLAYILHHQGNHSMNLYQAPYTGSYKETIDLLLKFGAKIIAKYPNANHGGRLCYILAFPGRSMIEYGKTYDLNEVTTNLEAPSRDEYLPFLPIKKKEPKKAA